MGRLLRRQLGVGLGRSSTLLQAGLAVVLAWDLCKMFDET